MTSAATVQLLVCTTCRASAGSDAGDDPRPGAVLLDRLRQGDLPEGVELCPVECLSNCKRGCSIALCGPGRWSYVYGNLTPADAATVAEGAARYRDSADGRVPWRQRPEHFRRNCIARIPPMEAANG